jgi:hypothetical protein
MAGPPLSAPLSAPLSPSASETPPILVAVDDDATSALEYAAQAARRAGCGLHLLHVVEPGSPATAHDAGEALLRRTAAHAAALTTGSAPVTTELAHAGPVADVLVHRAAAARQLVLQCRHETAGTGTCSRVVCRASCPVVMVPSHRRAATGATPADEGHQGLNVSPALPETLP